MVPHHYPDRLDFRLPPFLRLAWATAPARDNWSGPLNRLVEEVRTSEWMSVAAGIRPAAIIVTPKAQASALVASWSKYGLGSYILGRDHAMQIHALNGKAPQHSPTDEIHLLARTDRLEDLGLLWRSGDLVQMANCLGFPPCCATFLKTVVVEQRSIDTTWAMVGDHAQGENGARIADIANCAVNPLLSALGLRATPHRPCSFHCQATQSLAKIYGDLRAKLTAQSDPGKLLEILGWPLEWSSLHGIIEIKLPILKLCYEGDATASLYRVRLIGVAMPLDA